MSGTFDRKKILGRVRSFRTLSFRRGSSSRSFRGLSFRGSSNSPLNSPKSRSLVSKDGASVEELDQGEENDPDDIPPALLNVGSAAIIDNTAAEDQDSKRMSSGLSDLPDLITPPALPSLPTPPPTPSTPPAPPTLPAPPTQLNLSAPPTPPIPPALPAPPAPPAKTSKLPEQPVADEPSDDRSRIVSEILSTECSFRDFMTALKHTYVQRLYYELSPVDHKLCFSQIDQLVKFSELLIADVTKEVKRSSHSEARVGAVYIRLSPFFRMYTAYARAHFRISQLIEEQYRKKPTFRKVCDECKKEGICKDQTLQSILIMPIQRIPRHVLLLKELCKVTPKDHGDYASLEESLQALSEVAGAMNREIGDAEKMLQILELQRKMKPQPQLFKTGRTLIRSGQLKKMSHDRSFVQDLSFFLFNDCLVYAKPMPRTIGGIKYQFRRMIQVARVEELGTGADAVPDGDTYSESDGSEKRSYQFSEASGSFSVASTAPASLSPIDAAEGPRSFQDGNSALMQASMAAYKHRDDYFPFRILGTKSFVVYAVTEADRAAWVADLSQYADPNVTTDLETMKKEQDERLRRYKEEAEEKLKEISVSDPVRSYTATRWLKLSPLTELDPQQEEPELQLKFVVSKTGSDLCSEDAIKPFSVLALTLTILDARNVGHIVRDAMSHKSSITGVYCQIYFGKTIQRTKVSEAQEEPVWVEDFQNMTFLAGFHSNFQIKLKLANKSKLRKHPGIAIVELNVQDILKYTGVQIGVNQDQEGITCTPVQHVSASSSSSLSSSANQGSSRKLPRGGIQVMSSDFPEDYKQARTRMSMRPLPSPPTPSLGEHSSHHRLNSRISMAFPNRPLEAHAEEDKPKASSTKTQDVLVMPVQTSSPSSLPPMA